MFQQRRPASVLLNDSTSGTERAIQRDDGNAFRSSVYQSGVSVIQRPSEVIELQTLAEEGPAQDDGALNNDPEPAVEKSTEAYIVLVGVWCSMILCTGIANTIGTFQAYLGNNQLKNYSSQQIGWIFSTHIFLFLLGGAQAGPLFDAYSLRPLLIPGYIGFVAAMMAFSACTEYYQFMLSFGILGGLSASILWTTGLATIGHWFYYKRAIATGLATSAGPIGGILFPILFEKLIPKIGFAWTVRTIGFICLAFGLMAITLMRPRLPPTRTLRWNANFSSFTDIRFILTTLGMFALELAVLIPSSYITTYALYIGMPSSLSYQLLAYQNAAQILGRILPNWIADYWGRFNTMVLSSLPCAIVILVLWLKASTTASVIAFAVLFGLLSGTTSSLMAVCLSQLCRTEEYGSKYGITYLVISPASLIGIPIAGAILNEGGGGAKNSKNFQGLIIFCGTFYLLGSAFFALARIAGVGIKVRKVY
ncbi:MAG: hypothetical protein M1834_000495 [Cirrosporium novae-zelandiae]|nr:MAG: hypothetical protein M1834_000495 [Cirrosporium novae-zelandiae]